MTESTAAAISERSNGALPGVEIATKSHGELAFDAGSDEVGMTEPAVDVLDRRIEHAPPAGRGMFR